MSDIERTWTLVEKASKTEQTEIPNDIIEKKAREIFGIENGVSDHPVVENKPKSTKKIVKRIVKELIEAKPELRNVPLKLKSKAFRRYKKSIDHSITEQEIEEFDKSIARWVTES